MDSLSLFRRGPALYCRNGVVTSSLYADGAVRCRSYVLHIMALSALGYQIKEGTPQGFDKDKTMVDYHYANACGSSLCWSSLYG